MLPCVIRMMYTRYVFAFHVRASLCLMYFEFALCLWLTYFEFVHPCVLFCVPGKFYVFHVRASLCLACLMLTCACVCTVSRSFARQTPRKKVPGHPAPNYEQLG